MLHDTLLKIEKWINEKDLLDSSKLSKFIELLKNYKHGKWIYPGVIKRHLNISMHEAYNLLEFLKEKRVLQINYELYCHRCNRYCGEIFETFSQIPQNVECENCGIELNSTDNSIVIYRVIDSEQ